MTHMLLLLYPFGLSQCCYELHSPSLCSVLCGVLRVCWADHYAWAYANLAHTFCFYSFLSPDYRINYILNAAKTGVTSYMTHLRSPKYLLLSISFAVVRLCSKLLWTCYITLLWNLFHLPSGDSYLLTYDAHSISLYLLMLITNISGISNNWLDVIPHHMRVRVIQWVYSV